MTKDELSGLAFHMKQSPKVVFQVGEVRGSGKTEALCQLAKESDGVVVSSYVCESEYAKSRFYCKHTVSYANLSNIRGLNSRLYVDEMVVSTMINQFSNRHMQIALDLEKLLTMSDKVLVNKSDINAVLSLIQNLKSEINDLFSSSEDSLLDREIVTKIQNRQRVVGSLKHLFFRS
jgi:hypothetical protein